MRKFGQRIFEDVYTYVSDLMNEGQSDEWINRNRIAAKVLQLSDEPELMEMMEATKIENRMSFDPMNDSVPLAIQRKGPRPIASRRMDAKPLRRVAYMYPRSLRRGRNTSPSMVEGRSVMYMGPRQLDTSATPPVDALVEPPVDPSVDEQMEDLTGTTLEELLDFDAVLYESLGIDKKQMKEWTPVYCGKEYIVFFIKRLVLGFLTGVY